MTIQIRQLTKRSDPKLNILIPKRTINLIKKAAKIGKRRHQDEIIKRLAATITNTNIYKTLMPHSNASKQLASKKDLEKLILTIPSEIMSFLKSSATEENHSIDTEVSLRLNTTLSHPSAFGFSALFDTLMNIKFTEADAKAEAEAQQKGWVYVYQKQKLRLYLELEDKLPKKFKEKFLLKNLEDEIQKAKAEIKAEKDQEAKNDK